MEGVDGPRRADGWGRKRRRSPSGGAPAAGLAAPVGGRSADRRQSGTALLPPHADNRAQRSRDHPRPSGRRCRPTRGTSIMPIAADRRAGSLSIVAVEKRRSPAGPLRPAASGRTCAQPRQSVFDTEKCLPGEMHPWAEFGAARRGRLRAGLGFSRRSPCQDRRDARAAPPSSRPPASPPVAWRIDSSRHLNELPSSTTDAARASCACRGGLLQPRSRSEMRRQHFFREYGVSRCGEALQSTSRSARRAARSFNRASPTGRNARHGDDTVYDRAVGGRGRGPRFAETVPIPRRPRRLADPARGGAAALRPADGERQRPGDGLAVGRLATRGEQPGAARPGAGRGQPHAALQRTERGAPAQHVGGARDPAAGQKRHDLRVAAHPFAYEPHRPVASPGLRHQGGERWTLLRGRFLGRVGGLPIK